MKDKSLTKSITFNDFKKEILNDYKTIVISRETSLLGRKEVLSGKAKFGIFGDGKELPQIAMAKAFKKGDHRSGYYRDQTFMLALNEISVQQIFSALYANRRRRLQCGRCLAPCLRRAQTEHLCRQVGRILEHSATQPSTRR